MSHFNCLLLALTLFSFHEVNSSSDIVGMLVTPGDVQVNNTEAMFIFPCVAYSNESTLAISWLQEGQLLTTNDNGIKVTNTLTRRGPYTIFKSFLEVCVSVFERTGNYSCVVSLQEHTRREHEFRIISHTSPIVVVKAPPNNVSISFDKTEVFKCQFVASVDEPVTTQWLINGRPSPDCFTVSTTNQTSDNQVNIVTSITVKFLVSLSSGEYVCLAINNRNIFRKASRSFYVNVEEVVSVAHSPATIFYDNSYDNIILVCSIMGRGQTQLEWKHQGISISNGSTSNFVFRQSTYGPIQILTSFLSLCPSHQNDVMVDGEYTCEGSLTTYPKSLQTHATTVCSKLEPFGLLIRPLTTIVTELLGSVHLPCVAYSTRREDVSVSWRTENGTSIANRKSYCNSTGGVFLCISYLSIDCIGPEDEGNYSCVATSGDEMKQTSFHIRVDFIEVTFMEPSDEELKKIVNENSPVTLYCEASGQPVSVITWLKDGDPVNTLTDSIIIMENRTSSTNVTSVRSSLTLLSPSKLDSGQYWCHASNSYTKVEMTKQYQVDVRGTQLPAVTEPLRPRGSASRVLITGPAICIAALLVVLMVHLLTRELREQITPMFNFCLAVSLMYMFSTLSSSDSWSPITCTSLSALSHASLVAAALATANLLVLPLLTTNKAVTVLLLLLNWGLPVILTILSLFPHIDGYAGTSCYPTSWALWLGLILPLAIITGVSWFMMLVTIVFSSCKPSTRRHKPQHRSCRYHTAASGVALLLFDIACAALLASSLPFISSSSFSGLTPEVFPAVSATFSAALGLSMLLVTVAFPPVGNKFKTLLCDKFNPTGSNLSDVVKAPEPSVPRPVLDLIEVPDDDIGLPDLLELDDGEVLNEETEL